MFVAFLAYLVSVPYEITLLSNQLQAIIVLFKVSVPYEITLLSNYSEGDSTVQEFQYLMKLHYSQTYSVFAPRLWSFSTL